MVKSKTHNLSILTRGLAGGLVATIVNVAVFLIAQSSYVSFVVPSARPGEETMEIGLWPVVLFTIGPAIIAILLVMLFNRISRRPFSIYLVIAILIFLASFYPLSMEMANPTRLVLGAMHIVAAAGITLGIYSAYRRKVN